jgi:hypothetical protein
MVKTVKIYTTLKSSGKTTEIYTQVTRPELEKIISLLKEIKFKFLNTLLN